MPLMRACACGLRTMTMWSMPGARRHRRSGPAVNESSVLFAGERDADAAHRLTRGFRRFCGFDCHHATPAVFSVAFAAAACWIALTMFHIARAAADVAADSPPDLVFGGVRVGFDERLADSIMPGVQKPHCRPCSSWKPTWIESSLPPLARPSTVVTFLPSSIGASNVAGLDRPAVEQHGAGTTVARVAPDGAFRSSPAWCE